MTIRELHTDGNYNRKPYRTAAQKKEARANAKKVNGTYVSDAPVSRHPPRAERRG